MSKILATNTLTNIEQLIKKWKHQDPVECLSLIAEQLELNTNANIQQSNNSIRERTNKQSVVIQVTQGGKLPARPERL
jgi:hypothetical protein